VVTCAGADATATLDGFTITAGAALGSTGPEWHGGGLYNGGGSPTIRNCTFVGNRADRNGGAIYGTGGSPTISDCTFIANQADDEGGAIFAMNSALTVTRCTFTGNSADTGGALLNNGSDADVRDCAFTSNTAEHGGGIANFYCSPHIVNCVLNANSVPLGSGSGGGVLSDTSSPTLTNCTLTANVGGWGTGMACWGSGSPTLQNCILWGNGGTGAPQAVVGSGVTLSVTHSDVEGGAAAIQLFGGTLDWASGNIAADPGFVDADGSDDIPGTGNDDLRLSADSPCIDAGDNSLVPPGTTTDLDGLPRFHDGDGDSAADVDMGAYESQDTPTNGENPTVEFGTTSQSGSEGIGVMTVTAQLSQTSTLDVAVPYTVTGTATKNDDYTIAPNPTIIIAAGTLSAEITITVNDDSLCEGDETIVITLGTPTNADLGDPSVHTATIIENDSQPPVADPGGPYEGLQGCEIEFDGTASYDPDGALVGYEWDFDDGATGSGAIAGHVYATPGTYTLTLTVASDDGATDSESTTVVVLTPEEGIEDLISNLGLPDDTPKGTENSLVSKLEAALKSLDKENVKAAVNQLEAFVNQINALEKAGTLTHEQAQDLRDAAGEIIALLS
jgi:predicted outer membrane repeat protein